MTILSLPRDCVKKGKGKTLELSKAERTKRGNRGPAASEPVALANLDQRDFGQVTFGVPTDLEREEEGRDKVEK